MHSFQCYIRLLLGRVRNEFGAPLSRSPTLASFEAPETGAEGVLALVSELASGVAGFAKTLAHGRPNGFRAGKQTITCPPRCV